MFDQLSLNILDIGMNSLTAGATVVRKRRFSGFFGTDLDRALAALAPDVVEVIGVCTDICVLHTVADLRNRDYRVVVPGDLVETYDAPGHDADEANRFALAHTELIPILQSAVGPVILISGVGLLLLSMTNRFGRVVDRARILAGSIAAAFCHSSRAESDFCWEK